jgi:hypothetical protein
MQVFNTSTKTIAKDYQSRWKDANATQEASIIPLSQEETDFIWYLCFDCGLYWDIPVIGVVARFWARFPKIQRD